MKRNTNEWLDRKVADWVSKGWISEESQQKIRKSYGRDEQRNPLLTTLPLYALLAVIGLAAAGIALIWGFSQFWYYVSLTVRMGLACGLLFVTQAGVGVTMFQERQGSLVAEGVALVHCLGVFAVLALAEQFFYIGWDVTAYVAVCAILCLPVVYLLRSVAALAVYDLALLYWTAAGGPMNTLGGTALLWILLVLAVPFYDTLITMRDERRLSIFSWFMTITVFAAFGLAARSTDYVPFLMLGSLAVTIMLVGYSIDMGRTLPLVRPLCCSRLTAHFLLACGLGRYRQGPCFSLGYGFGDPRPFCRYDHPHGPDREEAVVGTGLVPGRAVHPGF